MKLVIDYGNTLRKIALYDKQGMIYFKILKELDHNLLQTLLEGKEHVSSAILSAVADYPPSLKEFLSDSYFFIELSEKTPVPIINSYQTPVTLGKDRLASVVAAQDRFPNQDILVIDAGTCITYDLITASKVYLGGGISPGITLRLNALHNFTAHLPLIEKKASPALVGQNTTDSILSGVMNGVVAEVNGIIERYTTEYPDIKVILSGGDAIYFDKRLKNNIFALPNIVLEGLNIILTYNLGKTDTSLDAGNGIPS
jgi:type III pantothenate kinase